MDTNLIYGLHIPAGGQSPNPHKNTTPLLFLSNNESEKWLAGKHTADFSLLSQTSKWLKADFLFFLKKYMLFYLVYVYEYILPACM